MGPVRTIVGTHPLAQLAEPVQTGGSGSGLRGDDHPRAASEGIWLPGAEHVLHLKFRCPPRMAIVRTSRPRLSRGGSQWMCGALSGMPS